MATRQAAFIKKQRAEWLATGRCYDCGGPRPPKTAERDYIRCQPCREARRESNQAATARRRANLSG